MLTIRDDSTREIIGTADIGSSAMMWRDRTATVRSLIGTQLNSWIGYQQELIASPGWHSSEPRLAATQGELLDRLVFVADESQR